MREQGRGVITLFTRTVAGGPLPLSPKHKLSASPTNEKYPVFVPGLYNSVGAEFRVAGGEPRMWGMRVRYNFAQ